MEIPVLVFRVTFSNTEETKHAEADPGKNVGSIIPGKRAGRLGVVTSPQPARHRHH
jgi:hypothetical protein